MSPLVQPALSFNFLVTMWEVQGPGMFGIDDGAGGWGIAARIASGFVNLASQILIGAFSEVGGLNAELDIETMNFGGVNDGPRRFAKTGKYVSLTFKRGVTFNADLWDWHQQVLYGSDPVLRKSGIILLLERGGFAKSDGGLATSLLAGLTRPPIAAWYFDRALPERLVGPQLDAKSNAVAMEQLDLAHEGLTRVSLSMIPGVADAASAMGGLASTAFAAAATSLADVVGHPAAGVGPGDVISADPPPPPPGAPGTQPPAGGADIKGDPPPGGP